MTLPTVKPILEKYFVVQWLVTSESPDKKNLENAGADQIMAENGGSKAGLPFFYFSDSKGKLIVNSIRPAKEGDRGGNVGCPYEPVEIDFFMSMLNLAAPKMTAPERNIVRTAFAALKKDKP